jgi:hypothetical protein
MCTSNNDRTKDAVSDVKLKPNSMEPENGISTNIRNMAMVHNKKLNTPALCIALMRNNLVRKLDI